MNDLCKAIARLRELAPPGNDIDLNHLILRLIRALHNGDATFEQPILTILAGAEKDIFQRTLEWLTDLGLLKAGATGVHMSEQGKIAVELALEHDANLVEFLAGTMHSLDRQHTATMLLSILRQHYMLRYGKG